MSRVKVLGSGNARGIRVSYRPIEHQALPSPWYVNSDARKTQGSQNAIGSGDSEACIHVLLKKIQRAIAFRSQMLLSVKYVG